MKVQLALVVFGMFLAIATCSTAQGYTIQNYLDVNCVTSIDYRDGMLAVGTARGLILMKDGQMRMLTADDGLPRSYIPRVAIAAAETLYVGPYYPDVYPADEPQRVYEVKLQGEGLTVRDITGDHEIRNAWQIFDTGPDGSLWLADEYAIHRFDGAEWHVYEHENYGHGGMGSVFFARDGTAYFIVYPGGWGVFKVSGESIEQLQLPFGCGGIALDADDALWALGENETAKGLFRYDGANWQLVSDDPVWSGTYMFVQNDMFFDGAGRLWVITWDWIALYENREVTVFDDASGLAFRPSGSGLVFTSYEAMPDSTALFGTMGAGLLTYDGGGFGRLYLDGLQGYGVEDILEDSSGGIWVLNSSIRTVSVFKSGHWSQIEAPWFATYYAYYGGPYMATDVNGDIWMTSDSGGARWDGSEFEAFDMSNSPLDSSYAVAIDSLGKKWFASPMSRQAGETATGAVTSFDGVNWQRYPSDQFFLSQKPICPAVGPGDKLWFTRWALESSTLEGFTTYDGETWENLAWDYFPVPSLTVHFDINGNALLSGDGLYRCYPNGDWERILDAFVSDVQSDADGRLYCAATDGLYFGEKDKWEKISQKDGLCPGWDAPAYSSSYPINGLSQVLIDHDGDKWIGTETGLNLLRDDGPAAQKLTLQVPVGPSQGRSGRTVRLTGEFINTYTTMPVSLWLACEFGGSFYFYPDWGTTMQSVDIVLPAHSIQSRELFSFDADLLPPGTYTFIGGISLRGGAQLMIGARDDKLSFATWVNE